MRKQLILLWPLIVMLLANFILITQAPGLVRYSSALFLLLFLPGWAWSFPVNNLGTRIVTAIGLSLALTIFSSMVAVYLPGPLTVIQTLVVVDLVVVTGWIVSYLRSHRLPPTSSGSHVGLVLILILIGGAIALRLPRLGYAEFHEDEAEALMLGVRLLQGEDYALFLHRKGPAQMMVPVALWLLTDQITEAMARLPFAMASLGSVLTVYLIGNRWYGTRAALAAALLWAVNGYAIAFGRMAQYQALVFFLGPLALYLLLLAADQPRTGFQILALILLATSLLAHFDALLLLPVAGYLLFLGYRTSANNHGRRYANIGLTLSLGLFFLLLASFYIPFVLDREFQNTTTYLAESRIKPGLLYNNLDLLRRFDRDYSSHFYLPLLAIGLVSFLFITNRGNWDQQPDVQSQGAIRWWRRATNKAHRWYRPLGIVLLLLVATTFWLPEIWQFGSVSLAIVPWLLLGSLSMLIAGRTETIAAWLLFGVPLIGYVFLVDDPRTHLYILYPGAALIAGAGWMATINWASRKFSHAGRVLIALGLLAVTAVMVYEVAIFLQTESAFSRLRASWNGSLWETVYDDIPKPREYFGYPKREGWKAIGALRAGGQYPGDFRSVNENFVVPIWYDFGQARSCYDTPAHFFIRLAGLETMPEASGYRDSGQVTREGEVRLQISSQVRLAPATAETFAVEDFAARFDALATPQQFTRQSEPAQPARVEFDGRIEFTGFDLPVTTFAPGDTIFLSLYWRALSAPEENYRAFAHLTDGTTLWAQQDDDPACRLPTSVWRTNQRGIGQFRLTVHPDTPPGNYPLIIGLYQTNTLKRLPITGGAGITGDDFLWLGDIEVRQR